MSDTTPQAVKDRTEEDAVHRQKQGTGAVPNVTPGQDSGQVEQLKEAMHELEEKKGDWGKSH